jgi:hypothetical protein
MRGIQEERAGQCGKRDSTRYGQHLAIHEMAS